MRNDKIIPGVVLILIGAVILLHNYGYLDFHWSNFIYLWPILIVIGGINLIFAHNRSAWATVIKLAVIIAGFGLIIFGNFGNKYNFWPAYTYHHNNDKDDDDNDDDDDNNGKSIVKVEGNSVFNQPYTADATVARLNISGGGTVYNLSDTTNQLFNASTKEFTGKYEFKHSKQDSIYVLDFDMKSSHSMDWHGNNSKTNSANFKLNPNPEWEINVETGATKLNFELAKFKIRSLKLQGGAASFDVKMGQPLAATNINVETGVSEVTIQVPQTAACRIITDSGLSSNHFDGFDKKENNVYETPGFGAAKNKMYINMSGGVSDFKVRRY